jgi:hypothetical protein
MLPSHVYVPARLPEGLGAPVEIRDAAAWPHRVRFADGKETRVSPTPVWQHEAQPGDRVTVSWNDGI